MAKAKRNKAESTEIFVPPNAFHLWVDGSHRPPDNAACAFLVFSERSKEITRIDKLAYRGKTINQMELEAIHKGLDYTGDCVIIHSDSLYAISCLTLWHKTWEKNNWISPSQEPVKNKDLIQSILEKMRKKKFVRFVKVKAHTGVPFNSVVDYFAQKVSFKMRDDLSIPDGTCLC